MNVDHTKILLHENFYHEKFLHETKANYGISSIILIKNILMIKVIEVFLD